MYMDATILCIRSPNYIVGKQLDDLSERGNWKTKCTNSASATGGPVGTKLYMTNAG